MKPPAQVKCPHCQNLLRVPPDMVDISLKCKHCGYILQIRRKAPSPVAAAPSRSKYPVAKPYIPPVPAVVPQPPVNVLPEYTPPLFSRGPTAPAPIVQPLVEELPVPEAGPSDYNPAFETSGSRHKGRGKYKGPRGGNGTFKWVAVGAVMVLGAGVLGAALFKPEWFGASKDADAKSEQAKKDRNQPFPPAQQANAGGAGSRTLVDDPLKSKPMPRRLLAIGISNYLYANSLQYGGEDGMNEDRKRRDFYKAVERLADRWLIRKDQRYFVTDGPTEDGRIDFKHPPLKSVVRGSIDQFLDTSRAQDRIVIIFSGHAIEKDGAAYLVPLEGEFEDVESLIPLKDFYGKLEKCPAQEKLVVYDVCRFDPGRGVERPAFGKMTEELEKALHAAPPGTTVWTSCSAGQYSYERQYASIDMLGLRNTEFFGSLFISMFFPADTRAEVLGKRQNGQGIHHPADPLPVKPVSDWMAEKLPAVVKELERAEQTPKLTVVPRAGAEVAFNDKEPFPARFELTAPPSTAKREEVAAMFRELDLPDIRSIRKEVDKSMRLADSFPFTEAQLKDFFNDGGPNFDEIAKAPENFAKDFPVRAAAVAALIEMRKLKQEDKGLELPEEFTSPVSDMTKKRITDVFQRTITERQGILEELRDKLEAAGKKKDMEKSKRWLATYEYAAAQCKARFAYIFEYNLALGNVKTDKLPELTGNQRKWKLASVEKMTSGGDIKALAQEAKDGFAEIATNYPHTPWAVLAKVQKNMTFGLKWEPEGAAGGEPEAGK